MKSKRVLLSAGMVLFGLLMICTHGLGASPEHKKGYIWASNPSGGAIYITTGALATVTTEATGIKSFVQTEINLDVTQMEISEGKADFGQSGFPRIVRGYDGTFAPYKNKGPTKNIRMVLFGPMTKTPWFSMKRHANITSWEQMKGKKIMGGVTDMYLKFAEATMKHHNVLAQVKELRMGVGNDDFTRSTIEGKVDVSFGWTGTLMYDFQFAGGYNVVEQPKDEVDLIVSQYDQKGWVGTMVRKGDFGAPQDYHTAAVPVALLAGVHVPKDIVYQVLKAIMANKEKLTKIHVEAGYYDKEDALIGLGSPIHPGAKQYYLEQGMWTSALEAENQKLLSMYGFKE